MSPSSRQQTPSTPLRSHREDSVTPPEYKPTNTPSKMLTIQSLLNPSTCPDNETKANDEAQHRSPTPRTATPTATASPTRRADTPATPSSGKGNKIAKDAAVFTKGSPTGQLIYEPFESSKGSRCVSKEEHREIVRHHGRFRIKPSEHDGEGKIGDYTRYIPYSSDKKSFYSKTGKEGFSVFQYTFRVPNETPEREYTVMWDYSNGLTRITPFFKACNHSKTVPAKALATNPGLKELAHSITGGALAAQGYWVPYACARAICLTFCYHIRWALTPIFGPSFIHECLPPNNPGYQRFKIDSETVRCATLEAQGWKRAAEDAEYPVEIPRSVPKDASTNQGKELRPRTTRTVFKDGSPFDSGSDASNDSEYCATAIESPRISPKTSTRSAFNSPVWTSVNADQGLRSSSPIYSQPSPLHQSLLNQPRQCVSWRPADPTTSTTSAPTQPQLSTQQQRPTLKRHRSSTDKEDSNDDYNDDGRSDSDLSSTESEQANVIPHNNKRRRRTITRATARAHCPETTASDQSHGAKSKKFTQEDFRVARLLLQLNKHDDGLARSTGAEQRSG